MALLPRLRARDVAEILAASRFSSLEEWARSRLMGPGVAWTLLVSGVPVWCGGVLDGAVRGIGALWIVGSDEAGRYVKHVLRVWRQVKAAGYRRLECKCYADNEPANRLAVRAGFLYEGTLRGFGVNGEDVNQYGLLTGDNNGRW